MKGSGYSLISGFAAAKESRLAFSLDTFHKLDHDLFHCQEWAKNKDMTGNLNYVSALCAQSEHLLDNFAAADLELSENSEIPAKLDLDQVTLSLSLSVSLSLSLPLSLSFSLYIHICVCVCVCVFRNRWSVDR